MSEKIYAWLLRLYPSRFNEAYGGEVLLLFRDRVRDETGFFPCLRLWLGLLVDLVSSVPREYLYAQPARVDASVWQGVNGEPAFYLLEGGSFRLGPLLLGSMLSSLALGTFWLALSHAGTMAPSRSHGNVKFDPQPAQHADAIRTTKGAEGFRLDAAERQRVIHAAAAILKRYYVERENGRKMGDALLAHEKRGDDNAMTDGVAFAALLTQQMRDITPDRHLTLDYSEDPFPELPTAPTPAAVAARREAMRRQNCTFEKVEILPHNIGYLKFNWFPDVSDCQPAAAAAMTSLNGADAIIFDLRDNRGGQPEMVMLIASYLFDHPEYMYNPRENTTTKCWTRSPVPGNRLADKPAYILTSGSTFSGAEHFSYDLKVLKRATLVGETTGGGAHSGVWHRIDDHFGMSVPETKAINPFAVADWAEIGVEPDVKVKAADAMVTAEKLAQSWLTRK